MRKLMLVCGFLLAALPLKANNIYISQNGAGTKDGSSCTNAAVYTFFNTSSNWGTGKSIAPGTTVHLCGTISGTNPLTGAGGGGKGVLVFQGSGASGSPITLLFESGASIQANYLGADSSAAILTRTNSWITIDGGTNGFIQDNDNGSDLNNHASSLAIDFAGCSNCEFKNLTISNLYVYKTFATVSSVSGNGTTATATCSSSCGMSVGAVVSVTGVTGCSDASNVTVSAATNTTVSYPSSCTSGTGGQLADTFTFVHDGCFFSVGSQSNVSIHDNVMHDLHWCISPGYGDSIQIYNNKMYNIDHGVTLGLANGQTNSNMGIHDNHIYSYSAWDSGTVNVHHHDGIFFFGCSPTPCTATLSSPTIYNNLLEGPIGGNITGHIFLKYTSTQPLTVSALALFNNVFIADANDPGGDPTGLVALASGSGNLIYNNTFLGGSITNTTTCFASNTNTPSVTFQNNVLTTCNGLMSFDDPATATFQSGSPDYNIYANGGHLAFNCNHHFDDFSQFANWRSSTCVNNNDSHSSAPASAGLSSSGVPQAGSPVIGAATNLTSLCTGRLVPLCKDTSAGNTRTPVARPATGSWDVGAYKF